MAEPEAETQIKQQQVERASGWRQRHEGLRSAPLARAVLNVERRLEA
jgi:hypothetical protein